MKRTLVYSFFLSLFFSLNVQADTTVTRVIVTPAPEPKEVVVEPTGYVNCYDVGAGWVNGQWVGARRICEYSNSTQGVAWIQGYWQCSEVNQNNDCTAWDWKAGHWEKTLKFY